MNKRTLYQGSSALLITLALSGFTAQAQTTPSAGATPGSSAHMQGKRMGEHGGEMQAWQARRLQDLKAKLQLTTAQESDWTRFTTAVQAMPSHVSHEQQQQDMMRMSTPERLDRMKTLRAQHQGEMNAYMDRVSEATKTFYASLTPEQKKTFDAETARMMEGPRHRGGHHDGHGMMHGGRS